MNENISESDIFTYLRQQICMIFTDLSSAFLW